MSTVKSFLLLFCAFLGFTWNADSQQEGGRSPRLMGNYRAEPFSPVNESNTVRLDSLLRGGNLYLSLEDAIALAIENNIFVETQRYDSLISSANVQRARSGAPLRTGLPTVQNGPASAQLGQALNIAGVPAFSITSFVEPTGIVVPAFDPVVSGSYQYQHSSVPQSNTVVTGTNVLVERSNQSQITYSQNFLTGTTVNLGYTDLQLASNSTRADLNPYRSAALSLGVTQHLLQGFGLAVNKRMIQIAGNNRELADLQFKQQLIVVVASATGLYWDLVSFNDDMKAKQQSVEYNQRLYENNKRQVALGALAAIEVTRAEAAVASAQQDLVTSRTRVLQQETILKDFLSRRGLLTPGLQEAHIIPTGRIEVPVAETIQPYQDLVARAFSARPEMAIARINIINAKINLRGSKAALLPSVDAFGSLANNGLAGAINTLSPVLIQGGTLPIGGYGDLWSQIADRSFPNYSVGLQLNIPIRNRRARADYTLDQITERQQELALLAAEKQVCVDVQNAIIGLQQTRAAYDAAVRQRMLEERTLDGEQRRLLLGGTTVFNILLVQRDLVGAQSAEVSALDNYIRARVQLDFATGQTLANNHISIGEAIQGRVSHPPSSLPPQP